jgi:uncharacterized membrane protein
MQAAFEIIAEFVALGAELAASLLIAIGLIGAGIRVIGAVLARRIGVRVVKEIWLHLAGWILLALEFALGADIVRTAISPDWDDIGKLAAIAAIRTVLSIFLERDLAAFERDQAAAARQIGEPLR